MSKSAAELTRAELMRLGPQAASEAVARDLAAGVEAEGTARFSRGDAASMVLARLSPDGLLSMARAGKSAQSKAR